MSSGWFDYTKPSLTASSQGEQGVYYFSAEKARCVEVFRMSSGWFDYTEPSRTASSQGEQGV